MTSGTWNRDDFTPYVPGWYGIKWTRTWSGADYGQGIVLDPARTDIFYRTSQGRMADAGLLGIPKQIRKHGWPSTDGNQYRLPKRARTEEHSYSMTERRLSDELVTYVSKAAGKPEQVNTHPCMNDFAVTTWAASTLLDANDQIKLVNKLRDKLAGSDFNMSVFLGEGHQACGLIAGAATRVAGAYGSMRRGNPWGAWRFLTGHQSAPAALQPSFRDYATRVRGGIASMDDVARLWLEMQYGWLPLLSDTVAAAQMLAHILNTPQQMTFRVSVRKEVNTSRRVYWQYNVANARWSDAKGVKSHRRGLIAKILEAQSVPQLLGLTDPAAVAWELLPYSFVADWFIPIGEWIDARELAGRLNGIFITSDKKLGRAFTPESQWFDHACRCNYSDVIFSRSISTTLKVPMPTFKPLTRVASWQHMANAVGLLVSGFAGSRTWQGFAQH